jgi:UDP-glucose:(heptosyl)LPS alpha-1,3-glucosyltransferase
MRIGMAYTGYGPYGGVERASAETARWLATFGHEVHFHSAVYPDEGDANVRLHRVPTVGPFNATRMISFAIRATGALSRGGYDITHGHGNVIGCDILTAHSCHREGMRRARQFRKTSVGPGRNFGVADRVRLFVERQNYGNRRFRRVIAVSSLVKRELMNCYGLRDNDITVIPNGVNTEEFNLRRREQYRPSMRAAAGVRGDDVVILFAGNEFSRKGLDSIIRSLRFFRKHSALLFVCGADGSGPYRSLAQRLGVESQVRFLGHCDQMQKYYAAADLFVLPTLHEAFGLVITEAMGCGLPVVVSKHAGAAEDIIQDGRDGFLLTNPSDEGELVRAMRLLIENPDLRQQIGVQAHERTVVLSWESITRRVENVYDVVHREKTDARSGHHDER